MKPLSRPKLFVLVLALLALPALTCGVAPAVRDLMLRMQRVESYLATVQLPPLLVDSAGNVVGPVLEYNDAFLYVSAGSDSNGSSWVAVDDRALATVQFSKPGEPPLMLEASSEELLAPVRGVAEDVYFESDDCTGTPLSYDYSSNHPNRFGRGRTAFSRGYIGAPGRTLWTLTPHTPAQEVTFRSRRTIDGILEPNGSSCEHTFGRWTMRRFHPVADLDALFTPPFRLLAQGPMATP